MAADRIVELRTILMQKDNLITDLNNEKVEMNSQHAASNIEIENNFMHLDKKCKEFASNLKILAADLEKERIKSERLENENNYLKDHIKNKLESTQNQDLIKATIESRVKISWEEGYRQGKREAMMDNKVNEYIDKYKREIEDLGEKLVLLEEHKEKAEVENEKLRHELSQVKHQIVSERNLQQSLSKEIESLTSEVKKLKQMQNDY